MVILGLWTAGYFTCSVSLPSISKQGRLDETSTCYWKSVAASDFGNGKYQSSLPLTCHGFMFIKSQATRSSEDLLLCHGGRLCVPGK
ncbi:hypothetical protein V6N12_058542 [Hibiscus sabdariffa]|uniref:Secreted protein n=1 Tax=Hibiscus sabdariffa TaxID=183260 RepID=A0ABR2ESW2_9ROSI